MMVIKCTNCKRKVFRYEKIGKGRVLRCWKGRIVKDYSIRHGKEVKCQCGNLIGIDEGNWVKMRQHSFTY
jgi:hypothetical protein